MTRGNPYAAPESPSEYEDEPEYAAGPDRLGQALVALPVLAAVPTYVLPLDMVEWVSVVMVIGCFVLASIDAQRLRISWAPTLLILVLWLLGYPYWLHRRARHGTLRFLPLGLAAMMVWGIAVGVRIL